MADLRGVLAGVPGTDLAAALYATEVDALGDAALRNTGPGLGWPGAPRRWFILPDTDGDQEPPRSLTALEQLVTNPADLRAQLAEHARGASIGLIVECDQGGKRFADLLRTVSYAAGLARALPEAALVFYVTADLAHQAMTVAAGVQAGEAFRIGVLIWPN